MKKRCGLLRNHHDLLRQAALLVGCSATFSLGGCSDRSQQAEEQVTQLQKRVEQLQGQLDAANRDLGSAHDALAQTKSGNTEQKPSENAAASASLPSKAALEDAYMASAKEVRKGIESKLTSFSIASYTLHSVQMPESFYPFNSSISLALRSNDGRSFQLDFPVKADFSGKWVFPDTNEIVARIEAAKNVQPPSENPANNNAPSKQGTQMRSPLMPVDGTVVIAWPDSVKPAASFSNVPSASTHPLSTDPVMPPPKPGNQSSTPQPPPPAPSGNKPAVMPVDRDVLIKFN